MNYLAHAHFSFGNPAWMVGNLISDYVKGRSQYDYPAAVQQGIRLHRAIDTFTDAHAATKTAKEIFRPQYRLYAGAFIDVVYDHFVAIDKQFFPLESDLFEFSQGVYNNLYDHFQLLPQKFQLMYPYMRDQNWLYNYRLPFGIEKSFGGLVRRSRYLDDSTTAFTLFHEHYAFLQECYNDFIIDLNEYLLQWKSQLVLL